MPPKPWEGKDQPSPYTLVNTRTGYPTTVIPITGWKGRALSVQFVLFHNTDNNGTTSDIRGGWSHTYATYLYGTSNGWNL